jgi:hypothetical protein
MDCLLTSRGERSLVAHRDSPTHARANSMEPRTDGLVMAQEPATCIGNGSPHE